MKKYSGLFLLLLTGIINLSMSANEHARGTAWISLQEAEKQFSREKKPILIDLYTNWCGWCRVMDKKTYAHEGVATYLNSKFYAVKMNAETKKELKFMGKTFHFNERYNTNELALFLTNNRLSYPTTIIIPADGSPPQIIPGYMEPADFEVILKYFGEGKFGKESFDKFRQGFKGTWK